MRKPNFFIVGMARGGTTSLWKYLRVHPNIFMSEEKEPNYFDFDILGTEDNLKEKYQNIGIDKPSFEKIKFKNQKNYLQLFSKATNQKIIGEASVAYIVSQTAKNKIHEFDPQAKILISLRNPMEAIYSLYHLYRNLGLYKGNFKEFSQLKTLLDNYKRMPKNILDFQKLFGKDNIKIIFFEDLNKHTAKAYHDILLFLGVDTSFIPKFEIHNSSKKVKKQKWLYHVFDNRFLLRIRKLLFRNKLGISDKINNVLGGFKKRPQIDEQYKEKLTKEFTPMIKELEEITNRNLSHWYQIKG